MNCPLGMFLIVWTACEDWALSYRWASVGLEKRFAISFPSFKEMFMSRNLAESLEVWISNVILGFIAWFFDKKLQWLWKLGKDHLFLTKHLKINDEVYSDPSKIAEEFNRILPQ